MDYSKDALLSDAGLRILKDRYLTDFQVCLYAAVCISIWPLIPSMNFFNNWIIIIYYLPIGFILHSHLAKNKIN